MRQNTFGGRAPAGPAAGAYSAPQTPSWILGAYFLRERREGERKKGKGRGKWMAMVPHQPIPLPMVTAHVLTNLSCRFVVGRKERIHKENRINRYAWPYAWGFTVGEYYQV